MLYLAGDRHGLEAVKMVEDYLKAHAIQCENLGVKREGEDLPLEEIIPRVARSVFEHEGNSGILICGTGIGVAIGANRFAGIRACLATDEQIAEWSKIYDNCNVLCLAGWGAKKEGIWKILDAWFRAKYDGDAERSKTFRIFDTWH
ncbi:MAG: RpiB/LacA/LacB family sugar-phosphate isomerase [Patescibacteria group bacterium]